MKIYYDNDSMSYLTNWDLSDSFSESEYAYESETGQDYYWDSLEDYIADKVDSGTFTECELIYATSCDLCEMYYYTESDSYYSLMDLYMLYLESDSYGTYYEPFGQWLNWSDGLYGIRRES